MESEKEINLCLGNNVWKGYQIKTLIEGYANRKGYDEEHCFALMCLLLSNLKMNAQDFNLFMVPALDKFIDEGILKNYKIN